MDSLETRKYHLIQQVMQFNEAELNRIEAYLEEGDIDPDLEKKLSSRAEQSEDDIKKGKVYTIEEVNSRINQRLDL